MDWNTLLSIAAIVIFVVLMMRGCGGMMGGGGCGMGMGPRKKKREEDSAETKHS